MSDLRPYWQRHGIQKRLFCLFVLLTFPVSITLFLIVGYWKEISGAYIENLQSIYQVLTKGE